MLIGTSRNRIMINQIYNAKKGNLNVGLNLIIG